MVEVEKGRVEVRNWWLLFTFTPWIALGTEVDRIEVELLEHIEDDNIAGIQEGVEENLQSAPG